MLDALDRFGEIEARLAGKRVCVFLDYDGTLTPIAARPDLAVLGDAMRATLAALAAHCTVAIVSGRDLDDVRRLVGLDGLIYAGNHGFDISGPGGLSIVHDRDNAYTDAVARAASDLIAALAATEGALVEPKRFAVAVHYRHVRDSDVAAVEEVVDRVVAAVPELRKTHGKKVFELRPRFEWDKGKAVMWLLAALGLDGEDVLPFYIGDDLTDEDAFRALAARGVTIYVGATQRTAAQYVLAGTEEVARFLARLTRALGG